MLRKIVERSIRLLNEGKESAADGTVDTDLSQAEPERLITAREMQRELVAAARISFSDCDLIPPGA